MPATAPHQRRREPGLDPDALRCGGPLHSDACGISAAGRSRAGVLEWHGPGVLIPPRFRLAAAVLPSEFPRPWKLIGIGLTRTIVEAQAQGYTHLRATCSGCGRISDLPWPLLIRRRGTSRETFLGNIPL
jgi:hypothetical protein